MEIWRDNPSPANGGLISKWGRIMFDTYRSVDLPVLDVAIFDDDDAVHRIGVIQVVDEIAPAQIDR